MPAHLLKFKKGMTAALNLVLIVAVALLVADVVWGVFTRYALGGQAKWTEELARFLLVWISLLGGAVAFGTKGHLGVDYFVGKLHPEQMTPALGWKMGHVYLALPIAGIFMLLFTLENLVETLATPASDLHEAEATGEAE